MATGVFLTGDGQTSFADDWYNRMHLIPLIIDFGAIGSDVSRNVILWNAYFGDTTLSSITVTNSDGITVGGTAMPRTMRPLEYLTYAVTAEQDGPATVDTQMVFNTNRPDYLAVHLLGTRAHLWPFLPNWVEPVQVTQDFRTDIFTSRSGREQRRALRSTPRKTIEFQSMVAGSELRSFHRAMAKWQDRPVVMGDPTRKTKVVVSVEAGDQGLRVASIPEWLVAGSNVVIQDGPTQLLATVSDVSDVGVVTFAAPLTVGVSAGAAVRPSLGGLLATSLKAAVPTNAVASISVVFNVDPGSETLYPNDEIVDVLNGREVLARRFNWGNQLDLTHTWATEQVDFGFGRIATFRPRSFSTVVRKATFITQGAEDAHALESFFWRQKGQRGEFYVPSGFNDLPLLQTATAGTSNLVIGGRETFDAYEGDTVYKAIAIYLRSGARIYRRIVGMFVDQGNTVLQCDKPLIADITPESVLRISWMPVYRLASDQFIQEWLSDSVARTQLAMQTLEDLPVENPVIPELDGAAQWVSEVWGDAAIRIMDTLDYWTNIAYPAVFFLPIPWCNWNSTQGALTSMSAMINFRLPSMFSGWPPNFGGAPPATPDVSASTIGIKASTTAFRASFVRF